MRHIVLWAPVAIAIGAAFACNSSSSSSADDTEAGVPADTEGGAVLPPSGAPEGPAGTGLATGLPCDVQAVLENRCLACHGGQMTGVPPMLNYDDMMAKSKVDPTKTLAQLSLDRMKSATSPMPPPPAAAPDPDEIQTFADWVTAGTPKGAACTDPPPAATDGGTLADGGDAGSTALKCTSGTTWTMGNTKSPLMHPGFACNACHQVLGGPNLRVAGTVYPSLHEPNDCNGKGPPPNLTVIITDKVGRVTTLPVNAAGNFDTLVKILPPYKAKVTDGVTTRAMTGSVTAGDCNSCHTEVGVNGAPGRVMAP